jgi:hypothetical protein
MCRVDDLCWRCHCGSARAAEAISEDAGVGPSAPLPAPIYEAGMLRRAAPIRPGTDRTNFPAVDRAEGGMLLDEFFERLEHLDPRLQHLAGSSLAAPGSLYTYVRPIVDRLSIAQPARRRRQSAAGMDKRPPAPSVIKAGAAKLKADRAARRSLGSDRTLESAARTWPGHAAIAHNQGRATRRNAVAERLLPRLRHEPRDRSAHGRPSPAGLGRYAVPRLSPIAQLRHCQWCTAACFLALQFSSTAVQYWGGWGFRRSSD